MKADNHAQEARQRLPSPTKGAQDTNLPQLQTMLAPKPKSEVTEKVGQAHGKGVEFGDTYSCRLSQCQNYK